MKTKGWLNAPNTLTVFRLLLIAVLIWMFRLGRPLYALGIYILAALTDLLDGYLARKNDQVTEFGKLADPLADKLMLLTALICLYKSAMVSPWVIILVAVKEGIMILGGFLLLKVKSKVVSANWVGKTSAVVFFVAVVMAFLHDYIHPWDMVAMVIALVMSFAALIQYAYLNVYKFLKENKKTSG